MNFANTSPRSSRVRFLVKVVASHTGASGSSPQTSDRADCSRAAPSADAPRCRKTPAAAARSATAPAGSRGDYGARKAPKSFGSCLATRRARAPGSRAADDRPERAPPAKHTKQSALIRRRSPHTNSRFAPQTRAVFRQTASAAKAGFSSSQVSWLLSRQARG